MNLFNRNLSKAMMALLVVGLGTAVHAEDFKKKHPRRAEVNKVERKERKEINRDEKNGKITPDQAKADRQSLDATKATERADVKANGGHLTKDEQKSLNQDLRADQQNIRSQRKSDRPNPPTPPPAPPAPAAPAPATTTGQ